MDPEDGERLSPVAHRIYHTRLAIINIQGSETVIHYFALILPHFSHLFSWLPFSSFFSTPSSLFFHIENDSEQRRREKKENLSPHYSAACT